MANFFAVLSHFLDNFLTKFFHFVRVNKPEWRVASAGNGGDNVNVFTATDFDDDEKSSVDLPLAKIIPLISDSFDILTSHSDSASNLRQLVNSQHAKGYCMELFEIYVTSS